MELILKRRVFTEESTIGELYVDGKLECLVLEDKDRGLAQGQDLNTIKQIKIAGKTAIPKGRYEIAITFSNRFQKYLPLLIGVPGYEGVRIHVGNTAKDTEGCLLPGKIKSTNAVLQSKVAMEALFKKLKAVEKKEKIFITIK